MKKWKLIKEIDVSPSDWFPVMKHVVELPNGEIIDDYYISPMGNVVMVIPFTTDKKIVLVKQYKHAIDEVLIEFPAGFQKKGVSLENSAVLELEEETGIKTSVENLKLLGKTASNPTKTTQVTYCYFANGLEINSKQKLDKTEEIEVLLVDPKQVFEMVTNGEIWVADSVYCLIKTYFLYPDMFS